MSVKFSGEDLFCAAPGAKRAEQVSRVTAPSLAELMSSERPAWLWDGERARIVWANAEGVRRLGGETVFDVIDQPFDADDEAVVRIRSLAQELAPEATADATLRLPGAVSDEPVRCRCAVHRLADGRPGLLLVALPGDAAAAVPAEMLHEMLMALPLAVVLAGPEGKIGFANAAARDLLDDDQRESLAALLGEGEAARILDRAATARLTSAIMPLATRYGRRDVRVTARALKPQPGDAGASLLVLLDDITERRALERALAGAPDAPGPSAGPAGAAGPAGPAGSAGPAKEAEAPDHRLSDSERRTFEALSAAILRGAEAAAQSPAQDAAPTPSSGAAAEEVSEAGRSEGMEASQAAPVALAEVPAIVSRALDAVAHAIVLHRGDLLLFVNRPAREALGFDEPGEILARAEIGRALAAADTEVSLATRSGAERRFRVTRSSFPWNTGPVSQSTLEPIDDAEASREAPPEAGDTAQQPAQPAQPAAPEPSAAEAAGLPRLAWEPVDAELRAILDTATDGIITLDEDGTIRGFSAGAEALFGYRLAEVAGRPFTDLLVPESRAVLRDYLAALDDSGLASVFNDGREVEAVVAQGGTVPLFIAIGRIGASGGGTGAGRAYCIVVRDLTQWKKTEADLRRSKDEAERASAQKSEFLANISHELRTPLNAILGFSEVMRTQRFGALSNQKYLGYANDIHESGEHLLSLINDLLDLSKVEAGRLELNFTSVNLASLIDQCLAVLQEHAAAARVVVRKTIPAELPNIVADLRSMKQILLNLLSNAIKFTDPGGQVIVSARMTRSGELTLSVKDTGIGMSEAELKAALEPFKRVESPGRERPPGTGLGLPLSKALTEANRASFAVSSEPQKGTLIEITFPTTRVLAG